MNNLLTSIVNRVYAEQQKEQEIMTDYVCYCMECGEIILREDGETPEEQEKWFNEDDELKLCASCEEEEEELQIE